jgi:hypothetical protein
VRQPGRLGCCFGQTSANVAELGLDHFGLVYGRAVFENATALGIVHQPPLPMVTIVILAISDVLAIRRFSARRIAASILIRSRLSLGVLLAVTLAPARS